MLTWEDCEEIESASSAPSRSEGDAAEDAAEKLRKKLASKLPATRVPELTAAVAAFNAPFEMWGVLMRPRTFFLGFPSVSVVSMTWSTV